MRGPKIPALPHSIYGVCFFREAGTAKSAALSGTLTSILSTVTEVALEGSSLGPKVMENGNITPATAL